MLNTDLSTQPCGCDPGCQPKPHLCEKHRTAQGIITIPGVGTYFPGRCFPDIDQMKQPVGTLAPSTQVVQKFATGATRNTDTHKYDYEGFINPLVLQEFGRYMHEHRLQRDGSLRDSDNWQKGIPLRNYVRSLVRHTMDFWRLHRGYAVTDPDTGNPATKADLLCAIMFNAMGYLKELLDPADINKVKEAR